MCPINRPIGVAFVGGLLALTLGLSEAQALPPARTVVAVVRPSPAGVPFRLQSLPVYAPGVNPTLPFYNRLNPVTLVAPGVTSQQVLYNWNQQMRAAAPYPPWMYGYNPYPAPIIVTNTVDPYSVFNPYVPAALPGTQPVFNPGFNPYNPYSPYGNR